MVVKNLTLNTYEEEVAKSDVPVIIDFFADWCAPCQMMKPTFEEVSEEYSGKLNFLKLDTQAEEGLAIKFGIQGIPSLVILKDEKEVGRIMGFMNSDLLKNKINEILEKI
ncbi:MAG: thioredoxin [Nanoarchaeota archaeon]|nr:thioredoxin [Nanoarchaeota archaeon]